jgi:hypothetical protein
VAAPLAHSCGGSGSLLTAISPLADYCEHPNRLDGRIAAGAGNRLLALRWLHGERDRLGLERVHVGHWREEADEVLRYLDNLDAGMPPGEAEVAARYPDGRR